MLKMNYNDNEIHFPLLKLMLKCAINYDKIFSLKIIFSPFYLRTMQLNQTGLFTCITIFIY